MANLFAPPPKYTLPLALGGDLIVNFRNNPSGDGETFVNYDPDVTLTLYIDADEPVDADAVIDGSTATVKVESEVADLIPADTKWRLIFTDTNAPSTETVVAYGSVKRFD